MTNRFWLVLTWALSLSLLAFFFVLWSVLFFLFWQPDLGTGIKKNYIKTTNLLIDGLFAYVGHREALVLNWDCCITSSKLLVVRLTPDNNGDGFKSNYTTRSSFLHTFFKGDEIWLIGQISPADVQSLFLEETSALRSQMILDVPH